MNRKKWASWACIAAVGMLEMATAAAGPYSSASRVQQGCEAAGQIGQEAFAARPPDAASSSQSFLRAEAYVWMVQNNLMQQLGSTPIAAIAQKSVYFAFTRAPDAQSAYMYGWSHCMDEYGPQ